MHQSIFDIIDPIDFGVWWEPTQDDLEHVEPTQDDLEHVENQWTAPNEYWFLVNHLDDMGD